MTLEAMAQIQEARLLLRWASADLNETERVAVAAWLTGESDQVAGAVRGVTRNAIWMARRSSFTKMRRRLERVGIRSTTDLVPAEGAVIAVARRKPGGNAEA